MGALSSLIVSQNQALGLVHLKRIRRPVLESCGLVLRRVRSWELHVNWGDKAPNLHTVSSPAIVSVCHSVVCQKNLT